MICACIQLASYQSWLKGGLSGKGPNQDSLKLKVIAHTEDPKLMATNMKAYMGTKDLNTRDVVWINKEKIDLHPVPSMIIIVQTKWTTRFPTHTQDSQGLALRSLWNMMTIWLPILAVSWSQNALHLNDILLRCHIHQRKMVRLCRHCKPIHDMQARLKLGKSYTILLLQPTQAWKRNTIPRTTCHVNFGFAPMTSIVVWRGAQRNGFWNGLLFQAHGQWKLGQTFPKRKFLYWSMLDSNFSKGRHYHHNVDGKLCPISPYLGHLLVCLPNLDAHSNNTFFKIIRPNHTTLLPEHRHKWESASHMNGYYVIGITTIPYVGYGCIIIVVSEWGQDIYCIHCSYSPMQLPKFHKNVICITGEEWSVDFIQTLVLHVQSICARWTTPLTKFIHTPTFSSNEVMRLLQLAGVVEIVLVHSNIYIHGI